MTGPGAGSYNSIWFIIRLVADNGAQTIQIRHLPAEIEFAPTTHLGWPFAWVTSIWACLSYTGILFLFAYFAQRFRVRRIEAKLTNLFHRRLSERAQIARDLNDSLLQTIEVCKLIADDALDPSSDLARIREAMGRLSNWLGQATGEGQAALNSLRTGEYDGNDLASSFQRAAMECLTHHSAEFAIFVEGKNREMHPMVRDEVYRLGYDLIQNAFRRHGVNRVEIELTYGSTFCLQVRSSGHILDSILTETSEDEHFDLDMIQRRALRFGASLNATALPRSTVALTLTVPGGIIFQSASSVLPRWLTSLWRRLHSRRSGAS